MAVNFTVYLDKAKKYRFNLKASNGEIIATGESYPDKKSVLKGIASIQKNAAAKIVDETGEAEAVKKPGRKQVTTKAVPSAPKKRTRKPKTE
jgi:uncharacterized protein YegP (UPF0339 family)